MTLYRITTRKLIVRSLLTEKSGNEIFTHHNVVAIEAKAIKKLSPNVKINFGLNSVTPNKIRSSGGYSPLLRT